MNLDRIQCDVRYALRQLRQFGDIERAIDALERIEEAVDEAITTQDQKEDTQ